MKTKDEVREIIASQIGEGVHTSLRKFVEGGHDAWVAIRDLLNQEWSTVCDIVAEEIVRSLEYHHNLVYTDES